MPHEIDEKAVIRPLEWTEPSPPNDRCMYDHVDAGTPFGLLRIDWKGWKEFDMRCAHFEGECFTAGYGSTLEEAKAEAEAWYRSKVMECLALVAQEPSAEMVAGQTVRILVTVGYASPAASFAFAQAAGHSPALRLGSRLVVDGVEAVVVPVEPTEQQDLAGSREVDRSNPYPRDVAVNVYVAMLSPEALGGR